MKSSSIVIFSAIFGMLLFTACQKKEANVSDELKERLIGSWHGFEFKVDGEDWLELPPYVIFREYGSGIELDNEKFYTHQAETFPLFAREWGSWKVKNASTLELTPLEPKNGDDTFEVVIIELAEDFLWIRESGSETKLVRIN